MYVGETLCGQVAYEAEKVIYEVDCGETVGGSVKITLEDQMLTVCEVEVFAAPSRVKLVSATQSSTISGGDAMRGIDGKTDGNYMAG